MPPQRLPTEIVEYIVDALGEGPRDECLSSLLALSLVHSAFVPRSQKHIFWAAALYAPYPTDRYEWKMYLKKGRDPSLEAAYKRTQSFVDTITRNPRLGSYVKDLTYRTTYSRQSVDIHRVITHMPNMTKLAISVYKLPGGTGPFSSEVDNDTWAMVLSVVGQPQFRSLTLEGVLKVPMEELTWAPCLDTLVLINCTYGVRSEVVLPQGTPPVVPALHHLSLDINSLENAIAPWIVAGASTTGLAMIRRITKLDLVLDDEDLTIRRPEDGAHTSLLKRLGSLRELNLTLLKMMFYDPPLFPLPLPLKGLNPSSFKTLTRLSAAVIIYFRRKRRYNHCEVIINDPYLGLWGAPLQHLSALQSLWLDFLFEGSIDVNQAESFGAQWERLPDTLATPGAVPQLREVGLSMNVRVIDDAPSIEELREDRNSARVFVGLLWALVKPKFAPLERMSDSGILDFSFQVATSEGPFLERIPPNGVPGIVAGW